jgi:hypothetical protein
MITGILKNLIAKKQPQIFAQILTISLALPLFLKVPVYHRKISLQTEEIPLPFLVE